MSNLALPELEKLLAAEGIGKLTDVEECQKAVVRAYAAYLDSNGGLIDGEIQATFHSMSESGIVIPKMNWSHEFAGYYQPNKNPWLKATDNFYQQSLKRALELMALSKMPEHERKVTRFDISIETGCGRYGPRPAQKNVFYKDEAKLFAYLKTRFEETGRQISFKWKSKQ